jgi:hypothetical protein
MDTSTKRYLREFIYSMVAYIFTLIISIIGIAFLANYPSNTASIIVALAPLIPVAFMIIAFLGYLNGIDELQQRIQLLSIGFAAGTTSLLAFSYGFLENVGFPPISLMWVFPVMMALWGIGLFFISRRYR